MPSPLNSIDPANLPPRLAIALTQLKQQEQQHGMVGTGRDTNLLIKEWYTLLGQVLIAEYLEVGAPNAKLNRHVFDALVEGDNQGNALVGQWVKLSRGLHACLMEEWGDTQSPAWVGLLKLSFGEETDGDHPVTKIMQFREDCGHVTFGSDADTVENIHQLLAEQIQLMEKDFTERPICFLPVDEGRVMTLQGAVPQASPERAAPDNIQPNSPWIPLDDGQVRHLTPVLAVKPETHALELVQLGRSWSSETQYQFTQALEAWREENKGHVKFDAPVPDEPDETPHDVVNLADALTEPDQALTLIEYRPGTGQARLAARLLHELRAPASEGLPWCIMSAGHPGARAEILGRAILRQAEKVLGCESIGSDENPHASLGEVSSQLAAAGKMVGFVVMGAGRILDDPELAQNKFEELFHACSKNPKGLKLLLLDHPRHGTRLPHDGSVLQAAAPAPEQIDEEELLNARDQWLQKDEELRKTLLGLLGQNATLTLSGCIDQLTEQTGQEPFPPRVEHALWEAAPFLQREGDTWQVAEPLAASFTHTP